MWVPRAGLRHPPHGTYFPLCGPLVQGAITHLMALTSLCVGPSCRAPSPTSWHLLPSVWVPRAGRRHPPHGTYFPLCGSLVQGAVTHLMALTSLCVDPSCRAPSPTSWHLLPSVWVPRAGLRHPPHGTYFPLCGSLVQGSVTHLMALTSLCVGPSCRAPSPTSWHLLPSVWVPRAGLRHPPHGTYFPLCGSLVQGSVTHLMALTSLCVGPSCRAPSPTSWHLLPSVWVPRAGRRHPPHGTYFPLCGSLVQGSVTRLMALTSLCVGPSCRAPSPTSWHLLPSVWVPRAGLRHPPHGTYFPLCGSLVQGAITRLLPCYATSPAPRRGNNQLTPFKDGELRGKLGCEASGDCSPRAVKRLVADGSLGVVCRRKRCPGVSPGGGNCRAEMT